MTDDRMALVELIEQGADSDLVRDMLAFAAERMMDLEIEARTGAPSGSRGAARLTTVTAIASMVGTPALAGSIGRSPSCAKAATSRAS